ncbi:glutamate receptor ionotropic, kainate 2 [Diachasma alloeum]|uniref:glutamate receptor ionotropic, kainate 2 n=1 Tax=Diachasma alloeum TaxID=454923 RepID=UPI0007384320|nr:glutamate receptor ionotropic, kainate 2 [Diachasma alloeum]
MTLFALGVFFFVTVIPTGFAAPKSLKVGALFHEEEQANYLAFNRALDEIQKDALLLSYQLEPITVWVNCSTDSFKTYLAACRLIEQGVIAIFGPGNPLTSNIVSSITSRYDIPHIEYIFKRVDDSHFSDTTINMYPDAGIIAEALADLLESTHWTQFTVLYETNDGLSRLQKLLENHGPKDFPVTIRQLNPSYDKLTNEPDYRTLLKEVANSSDFNIILDVRPHNIKRIIEQARQVKLLEDYYHYLITDLHSPTAMIAEILNKSSSNVTVLQLLTDEITEYDLTTVESAVIFDGVFVLNEALKLFKKQRENDEDEGVDIEPGSYICSNPGKYAAGLSLVSLMRGITTDESVSGPILFREGGGRSFKLTLKEFYNERISTSGYWDDGEVTVIGTQEDREAQAQQSIEKRIFTVTTRLGEPYVMEVTDGSLRGTAFIGTNKRYEGYAIDLIDELAQLLKFTYNFELVPGNNYGTEDPESRQWDGLIGRLLRREVDLAICDLTITKARESAVDFTMPFMDLGISILFAKSETKEPELWSFLRPFSVDVYIYLATAWVSVSLLFFLQARMAPEEWVADRPSNSEPEELENSFDLKNSLWLTTPSIVQAGSDILPRADSTRLAASMWWFFILIMVSSWTANLTAFLTATKKDVSISSVTELAAQTKIKYGAIRGGSTAGFFKGSNTTIYKKMWAAMNEAKPSVFTEKNEEGVERVDKGKRTYAFLMESTGIEYAIERNCNLVKVGDLLDSKGYGIALPPNSPYRTLFSEGILKLQERGILRQLKNKWWLQGSKNCTANQPLPSSGRLTMVHVGGVYLVFIFGLFLAFLFAIFECIWNVRKIAIEEKITPLEAFIDEFKFVVNVTAHTKPVRRSKLVNSSRSSTEGFATAVAAKRSMGGSFLELDILNSTDSNKQNPNNMTDHTE